MAFRRLVILSRSARRDQASALATPELEVIYDRRRRVRRRHAVSTDRDRRFGERRTPSQVDRDLAALGCAVAWVDEAAVGV
jgi:hypothetical protein